jgi:2-methylcitrate dehydratase PrpD
VKDLPQTQTRHLAQLITKTTAHTIPTTAISKAKACILDTLGCAFGAVHDDINNRIFKQLKKLCGECQFSDPDSVPPTIWGLHLRMPLLTVVFYNSVLAHTLELDDVHRKSKVHAGVVVVPTALTVGESLGSSGLEVLRAIALGYEVAHRLGHSIDVQEHRARGWHATSTMGVFGAATTAGILLKLPIGQLTSALGLAGTQASGVWAFHGDGASNKRLHAGVASRNGTLAAHLAQTGLTGPSQILEATNGGLFPAMSSNYNFEAITHAWGEKYLIEGISVKPFACCRSIHPILTAVMELRFAHDLDIHEVERIDVDTYSIAVTQCDHKLWPETSDAARLNARYAVAVALVDGEVFSNQFSTERINDPDLKALAPEVSMRATDEFEKKYPDEWGCRIRLHTRSGHAFEKLVRFPLGDPENPLDDEALVNKFLALAGDTMPKEQAQRLVAMIENLDQVRNVRDLPL